MNYAMQLSASGVLTSMYRQDVLANNLANVNTVGFKPDFATTRQRDVVRQEDGVRHLPSNTLLERLGAGVLMQPNTPDLTQGEIERTGNPLDLAIKGTGFFVVAAGQGPTGTAKDAQRVRLTRDGRFTLDEDGQLLQAATGLAVLDPSGRPILISAANGPLTIDPAGRLVQRGQVMAQISVVDVPDPEQLRRTGNGLFQPSASQVNSFRQAKGRLFTHSVESSGVDPIKAMLGVSAAGSDIATNTKMIQLSDELMGKLINTVGRVA